MASVPSRSPPIASTKSPRVATNLAPGILEENSALGVSRTLHSKNLVEPHRRRTRASTPAGSIGRPWTARQWLWAS